jgi:hypothetical protein
MRKLVAPLSICAVGLVTASAAWACAPGGHLPGGSPPPGDRQTRFKSCNTPEGATKACKPMLGTPTFPNATAIKGPAGSSVLAFVAGGLEIGEVFNLKFLSKPQLESGIVCSMEQSTAVGGPTVSDINGALEDTIGTIPTSAPLGGGQVCFAKVGRAEGSLPAKFKVIV